MKSLFLTSFLCGFVLFGCTTSDGMTQNPKKKIEQKHFEIKRPEAGQQMYTREQAYIAGFEGVEGKDDFAKNNENNVNMNNMYKKNILVSIGATSISMTIIVGLLIWLYFKIDAVENKTSHLIGYFDL